MNKLVRLTAGRNNYQKDGCQNLRPKPQVDVTASQLVTTSPQISAGFFSKKKRTGSQTLTHIVARTKSKAPRALRLQARRPTRFEEATDRPEIRMTWTPESLRCCLSVSDVHSTLQHPLKGKGREEQGALCKLCVFYRFIFLSASCP